MEAEFPFHQGRFQGKSFEKSKKHNIGCFHSTKEGFKDDGARWMLANGLCFHSTKTC